MYTYIANWKMNFSFDESINFCKTYKNDLEQLASQNISFILCPTFVALAPITEIFKNTAIKIGAQDCSKYKSGSFTGETSVQSLAEIGITHCFLGHSERRIYFGENIQDILKKMILLFSYNIQPIICIGETKEHFENAATFTVLAEQLRLIIEYAQKAQKNIIIAYEPVWSIGNNIVPENSYLEEVFAWIIKFINSHTPQLDALLLYGGSVNEHNIEQLKQIPHINGFLIGGASTQFEKLRKIISE